MPNLPPETFDFSKLTVADLLEVHNAVRENTDAVSARRQSMNAVYVGFNTVALTGIGAILFVSQEPLSRAIIAVAVIAAAIFPVNFLWLRQALSYKIYVDNRYAYLRAIEHELKRHWGDSFVGAYDLTELKYQRVPGGRRLDVYIVVYFLLFYPVAALIAAIIVTINSLGLLSLAH